MLRELTIPLNICDTDKDKPEGMKPSSQHLNSYSR